MNIAFIPVRCGSQSIPFKNIKNLCGKPLIYWTLSAAVNSNNIDKIYVATDCKEIKNVIKRFNFPKVTIYDRDKKNASNEATTESVMLEFLYKNNFSDDDLFLLMQATSPLTTTEDIDLSLQQLKDSNADSLLSCAIVKKFFWNKKGESLNYDYKKRPRRQDWSGTLVENGAFYINSIANIKKYKNRLSGKISIYKMPEYTMTEVDEGNDWLIAEQLMYSNLNAKK